MTSPDIKKLKANHQIMTSAMMEVRAALELGLPAVEPSDRLRRVGCKSWTAKCPDASIIGASTIGVVCYASSFYVNRTIENCFTKLIMQRFQLKAACLINRNYHC